MKMQRLIAPRLVGWVSLSKTYSALGSKMATDKGKTMVRKPFAAMIALPNKLPAISPTTPTVP